MSPRKIGVTELVLRDAHQSLMATRMALEDMVDACADIDAAGYWSVECWGGATFDSCIRFLNEDPWVRLQRIIVFSDRILRKFPYNIFRRMKQDARMRHTEHCRVAVDRKSVV